MIPGVTPVHGCELCNLEICRDCADGVPREVLMSSVTGTLAFDVQVQAPSVLQVCVCACACACVFVHVYVSVCS